MYAADDDHDDHDDNHHDDADDRARTSPAVVSQRPERVQKNNPEGAAAATPSGPV